MDSDCGSSSAVLEKDIEVLNKEVTLLQVTQFNSCTTDNSWNTVSNNLPVIDNSITVPHHRNQDTTGLNFAAKYSNFDNYNVRYPSGQTAKENTPAYSGQSCLQFNGIYPGYMSQSTSSIEQHFVPANSRQTHDNDMFSSKQNNVRVEVCPRASDEQPCINFTGISHGVFILPQPILPILQPLSQQGSVIINFEACNNSSDINPIQPPQEINPMKSYKGQVLMEQHNEAPLSEIPMIYSSNAVVRNSHQGRISMAEQQSMMLHRTAQNGSYATTVLHSNDSEECAQGTDQRKDSTNFAVMNSIDNNKNITKKTGQKFHCRICEKCFSSLRDLQLHWNAQHAEDTLLCGICNRQFATLPQLRKHKSNHGKLYACELCEFRTFRKKRMSSHMAKHLEETPFVCDKCKEPFTRQNDLTAHLYRCHSFH